MSGPYTKLFNNTPNPMYGNLYGFSIASLPGSYSDALSVLTTVSTDITSAPVMHGGQGVEVLCLFSDGTTTCSIDVTDSASGDLWKTFTNVSQANCSNLFITYFDIGYFLEGAPIKIRAYNFTGAGTVTVNVRRTA